jgi:hypothetical protein
MRGRAPRVKLLLGIPSAGAPAAPFLESLGKIALPADATSVERAVITGNFVPAQRDLLVERALERGVDVLVMCDDDMVLPADAIVRLCATLARYEDAALAGALYYSRDGFRPMTVDRWNPEDTRTAVIPAFDRDPVAVDGVGFGCVAVKASALQALAPPYFSAHVFIERTAGRVRVCDEDYLFCARLRAAGWRVLLDPAVRCGHYDRGSQTTAPRAWEPAAVTSRERMAAIVDGRPQLVHPVTDAPGTPETHVTTEIDYVIGS